MRLHGCITEALRLISGPAPVPPRFVLGVWWSRYWPYTAEDLEDIARGYHEHVSPTPKHTQSTTAAHTPHTPHTLTDVDACQPTLSVVARVQSIPLDVLVSDMAWHYHGESPVDWGGYTWSPQLFPQPDALLDSMKKWGLNITLNLHLKAIDPTAEDPAHYLQFAKDLGLRCAFPFHP